MDLKYRFGFDDSLDVVGVHFGAGVIGTLSLGFIAFPPTEARPAASFTVAARSSLLPRQSPC